MRILNRLLLILFVSTATVRGDESLHRRIDGLLIDQSAVVAPLTGDAEFLRRVTLDLAGRIPTTDEIRGFIADQTIDKRRNRIEALLASSDYVVRMRDQMHVMLMERLGDDAAWMAYLEDAFEQQRPWDRIVHDLLDPPADDPAHRGAAFFLTKRLENYGQNPVDHPALVRDVGRLFLGVDLQCAQCHDHLSIDEYKQVDFQGLAAFTGHTFIRKDVNFPAVGEKVLAAPVEFTSVFTGEKAATGPRLPGGSEVKIPKLPTEQQFEKPPDRKTKFPGQPKFRPLAVLADQVTSAENRAFARNSVNRFWFLLFGRGLVMPLDLHHSKNPPTHPRLLDLLTDEFIAHQFDIRWLMRELALTDAYQRSSQWRGGADSIPSASYAVVWERPLSAEQLLAAVVQATGHAPLLPAVLDNLGNDEDATEQDNSLTAYDSLRERFQEAFANVPRDPEIDFRPSVKAALFLMNDGEVGQWFERREGNTVDRLLRLPQEQLAEELYLTCLSRFPTEAETAQINQWLEESRLEPEQVVSQLLWGLVASAEFALNH